MFGRKHSDKTKKKQRQKSLAQFKDGVLKATREKQRKATVERHQSGKKFGFQRGNTLAELSDRRGEKNSNWRGGISFEEYPVDWTETLRRSIRERDHYTCRICGKQQGDKAHDVHHIDYNKSNCNPENLITLCHGCHTKTGFNRHEWITYFDNLLNK